MLDRPSDRVERWTFIVVLVAILGLFAAETFRDFEPAKLSALFFLLFWFPLLTVHEVGHALCAGLLGWRVDRLSIGFGRPLWRFRIRGAEVEVRRIPLEGFVQIRPRDLRRPRLESALIYLAGPGVEILLAVVVALLVGPGALFEESSNIGVIAGKSFCACVAVGAFFNLIPHVHTGSGTANDGLGILRSFSRPMEQFAAMIHPEDLGRPPPQRP